MSAHLFNGCCPDDTQPDSRDPECPACVEMSIPGQRIADLERRLELSEARRLDTVERSARVQYCQTCHGGMGFVAPEGEPCPWCRLAESEAERARHKAALAGALHVSGASEDTLVEFVARLYARASESEAACAAMREALLDVRNTLRRVWAAIGDELGSRALGGKGLAKEYLQSVSSEVEAAERKAEAALSAVSESGKPR